MSATQTIRIGPPPPPVPEPKRVDVQDVLVVIGFLALETGVAALSWKAATILGGLTFYFFAWLIERSKRRSKRAS
jgi:hypothetical protein